nr:putative transposase (putative), gypsy type [Tanacetum cinerariifolium]
KYVAEVGSLGSVYRPKWGVTNGSLRDTPEACQDLVDHAAPPSYFSELRHMHNEDFLRLYNINLARQVAMGSQLRLRFEQEAKLLRKSVAQVAHRDQRIQARESEIKNLEALLETEAEMDARLDALSVDFDEELYPHMLTAIAGCRWVIGHGLRLAMMKCAESLEMRQTFADVVSTGVAKGMSEGLKHGVEHGYAQRTVESLEAYDPEAEAKFAAALQSLKDLKYPLLDQLEGLRDAPIDVIMAALYLESDTEGMPYNLYATSAPAPLSSPSRYIQSRIVCRTHGVGSAHHARSDRVPVSAPIVVPQVLALLLVDAATQTESGA